MFFVCRTHIYCVWPGVQGSGVSAVHCTCNARWCYCIRMVSFFGFLFFCSTFCWFYVVIRFFHPHHNSQWPPTLKDFFPRFYPLHLFSYLNSWERYSIFPFECSVLTKGTTQVPFLKRLWYDAVLDWGLNPGPTALDASTLPLGYQGVGKIDY